jgi:predicted TIM-barrel enzyme
LSAKCEEAGGIDLIVIYNSGRYRMAGRGSLAGLLAYGNANEIVMDMAKEVLPVTKKHRFSRASTGLTLSVSLISFWMILKRLALLAFRTSQPWG